MFFNYMGQRVKNKRDTFLANILNIRVCYSLATQRLRNTRYVSHIMLPLAMIKDFKCKETETIWEGKRSRKISSDIQYKVLCKLRLSNEERSQR